jgi:glutamate synthase domain-containing protein 1
VAAKPTLEMAQVPTISEPTAPENRSLIIVNLLTLGILVGMPHDFYSRKVTETLGLNLGPQDSYGTGIVFTPKSDAAVNAIKEIFEAQAKQRGMKVIGWRPIETGP